MWKKEKLLVFSNFFFCHYVFKKLSATEASESIYMRERVKCEEVSRKGKHINIVLLSKKSNIYFFLWGVNIQVLVDLSDFLKWKFLNSEGSDQPVHLLCLEKLYRSWQVLLTSLCKIHADLDLHCLQKSTCSFSHVHLILINTV